VRSIDRRNTLAKSLCSSSCLVNSLLEFLHNLCQKRLPVNAKLRRIFYALFLGKIEPCDTCKKRHSKMCHSKPLVCEFVKRDKFDDYVHTKPYKNDVEFSLPKSDDLNLILNEIAPQIRIKFQGHTI
jgi:hypothetical protein